MTWDLQSPSSIPLEHQPTSPALCWARPLPSPPSSLFPLLSDSGVGSVETPPLSSESCQEAPWQMLRSPEAITWVSA